MYFSPFFPGSGPGDDLASEVARIDLISEMTQRVRMRARSDALKACPTDGIQMELWSILWGIFCMVNRSGLWGTGDRSWGGFREGPRLSDS